MSTALDYIGRKFDVLALRGATPLGETLLSQTLFDTLSSGDVCTGVQKLAQRWTIMFLTEYGSMKYWPELGTDFMSAARKGFLTETDVILEFNMSNVVAGQMLRAEEDDTWHPEDRYDRAELTSVALTTGRVALSVEVWSMAGTSRKVILPISTVPIITGV